jgi:HAD superfamily hydrolase (TIGR01484 family)
MSEIKFDSSLLKGIDEIKVIYTDVDNTLVNDGCLFLSTDGYSKENAQAIFEMLRADVDVVMVSGRDKNELFETARLLGFNNYIGNLGMQIVYNRGEKVISNYGIDIDTSSELKNWILKTGVADKILKRYQGKVRYYTPWSDILTTHPILIGEIQIVDASKWMTREFPMLRIIDNGPVPPEVDFSKPHAYHIVPKGVGKRSAVAIDKKERDLKRENLIAIGDSYEDLTIADEVALYFNLGPLSDMERDNVISIENEEGLGFSNVVAILKKYGLV